jgi:hypothetical protein
MMSTILVKKPSAVLTDKFDWMWKTSTQELSKISPPPGGRKCFSWREEGLYRKLKSFAWLGQFSFRTALQKFNLAGYEMNGTRLRTVGIQLYRCVRNVSKVTDRLIPPLLKSTRRLFKPSSWPFLSLTFDILYGRIAVPTKVTVITNHVKPSCLLLQQVSE